MNLINKYKQEIYKDMENLLSQLDGSIGLPMKKSGFITDDGFDLGSTATVTTGSE